MKKLILLFSTAAITLVVSGCGKGMSGASLTDASKSATAACSNAACVTTPVTAEVAARLSAQDLNGAAGAGIFSKMTFISLDPIAQTLTLALPMGSNLLGGVNGSMAIPQLPGAKVGLMQDSAGNTFLGITVPLKDIVHGASLGNPRTLPNGNPLPGVPSGELPGLNLNIGGKVPIHLYLGINVIAAFIELPQADKYMSYISAIPFQMSFDLKNSSKAVVGVVAPIAPVTTGAITYSGGVYVASKMPAAIARALDDMF